MKKIQPIVNGLITAINLSIFIYLASFGIENIYINSIFGLIGLYRLLNSTKKELFFSGFFIGILWFYWVGLSYKYYELESLAPIVVVLIGLVYGILFYLTDIFNIAIIRVILLFSLNYIYPFDFNWFNFNLIFVHSIFDITSSELSLAFIFLLLFLLTQAQDKKLKILIICHFVIVLNYKALFSHQKIDVEQLKSHISFANYNVEQSKKWDSKYRNKIIQLNFKSIIDAIKSKKDLVVLPETAFPMVLEDNKTITNRLLKLSKKIAIITGALDYKNDNYYNASFFFYKEKMKIAHKVVLVPFGEEVPLPKILKDWVNDTFFHGAQDYAKAPKPTDFKLGVYNLRSAICYEATSKILYKNLKPNTIIVAISNNAWFTPSIEPILQKIFLQYYAHKYNIVIINSINGSPSYVIN